MAEKDKYQELVGLAGEYVLGTLEGAERREFEALMERDEALANAVRDWQARLDPLAQAIEPVTVPKEALGKILTRIEEHEADDDQASAQIFDLTKRLNRWRRAAVIGGSVAASLLVFVMVKQFYPGTVAAPTGNYIAVLQADDKDPRFVASIDLQSGQIDIVRLGERPRSGKAFELWAIGGGRDKPQSLGVMDTSSAATTTKLLQTTGSVLDHTVFAISLEPAGGSPTGQPTGPVLFTGKLVKIEGR